MKTAERKKSSSKSFEKLAQKPIVVISGVNLVEGGPLSIIKEAVTSFARNFLKDYELILFVYDKSLFKNLDDKKIQFYEFTYPKKSWFLRVWFEYVHSYFLSQKLKPSFWFSIHDMTSNVSCKNQITYCHNPAPFYQLTFREALIEKSLFFFRFFYSFFYRVNIHSNNYVIVQQEWLRDEFKKRYKIKNVIVAHPEVHFPAIQQIPQEHTLCRFFYPSFPRVFKNFEVVLNAVKFLEQEHLPFEIIITLDGSENKYADKIVKKYKRLSSVKFIGLQKREAMWDLYNQTDCLVFASKLETWGLPITETKLFNKPMLVANCRYAHETVGNYRKVCFFGVNDPTQLSQLMKSFIQGVIKYDETCVEEPSPPFTKNWNDLFSIVLENCKK